MILFLANDGRVISYNTFLQGAEAEAFVATYNKGKAVLYDEEYDIEGGGKVGHEHAHYYDEETKTIHVEYTEREPQPEPEVEPLSETEQAIWQTALTTEYTAALVEMMLI